MKNPEDYNVRAVERALQILNCFDDAHSERGVSEIAEAVGLHKATAHRIVTTLLNYGYLERADNGQKYRLGLALADLGFKVVRNTDLRQEALPYMKELNTRFDETCDLSIFDKGQVFYLEVLHSKHALDVMAAVGQRLPACCTASGKAILAFLPLEEVEEYLEKPLRSMTDKTITSPGELKQELQEIRETGYAVDNEETELGIRAISSPVFTRNGSVIAAISILSPSSRSSMTDLLNMAEPLMKATQSISKRMGYKF